MIETHRPQPASSPRPFAWLRRRAHELGALAALLAFVGMGVLTYNAATQTSAEQLVAAERSARVASDARARRRELVQCQRGNDVRSLERWRIRRDVLDGRLDAAVLRLVRLRFPILDCPETVALSRNVPLDPAAQLRLEVAIIAQPRSAVPDRTSG